MRYVTEEPVGGGRSDARRLVHDPERPFRRGVVRRRLRLGSGRHAARLHGLRDRAVDDPGHRPRRGCAHRARALERSGHHRAGAGCGRARRRHSDDPVGGGRKAGGRRLSLSAGGQPQLRSDPRGTAGRARLFRQRQCARRGHPDDRDGAGAGRGRGDRRDARRRCAVRGAVRSFHRARPAARRQ